MLSRAGNFRHRIFASWRTLMINQNFDHPSTGRFCSSHASRVSEDSMEQVKDHKQPSIESNPYYSKYAAKIEDKMKEKIKTTSNSSQDEVNNTQTSHDITSTLTSANENSSDKVRDRPKRSRSCDPPTSRLDRIVKLSLFKTRTELEIKNLWNEYHRNKDGVFGCIEAAKWKIVRDNGRKYPLNLYVIPRSKQPSKEQSNTSVDKNDGFEFFVGQFKGSDCYFTPLLSYQTHGEYAPVSLTIFHYDELLEEKGIVLMRGELDIHILNVIEAQCLVNQIYLNYGKEENSLLRNLNTNPAQMDHQQVVDALLSEAITLSPTTNVPGQSKDNK